MLYIFRSPVQQVQEEITSKDFNQSFHSGEKLVRATILIREDLLNDSYRGTEERI